MNIEHVSSALNSAKSTRDAGGRRSPEKHARLTVRDAAKLQSAEGLSVTGRNPDWAIASEMALPIGPLWSTRTAEPVATPSWLEWVSEASPMCGPSGSRLRVRV